MVDAYPWLVMAAPAGLVAYCLAHVLVSRLARKAGYFPLMAGFAAGLIAAGTTSVASLAVMKAPVADWCALLAINFLAYAALGFGYFSFVNLNIASLRIRMLQELLESGGQIPRAELLGSYNSDQVIALRITRLIGGGHLVERQGRFYIGKKLFLALARVFELVRWFIMGPSWARAADAHADPSPGGAK